MVCRALEADGHKPIGAECRADNEKDVERELKKVKPDRVFSLIGRTRGSGLDKSLGKWFDISSFLVILCEARTSTALSFSAIALFKDSGRVHTRGDPLPIDGLRGRQG